MEIGTLHFWIGPIRYRHLRRSVLLGKLLPLEEFANVINVDRWGPKNVHQNANNNDVIFVEDSSDIDTDSSLSSESDDVSGFGEPVKNVPVVKYSRITGKPANFVSDFVPHGFERATTPVWETGPIPVAARKSCVNRLCDVCKITDSLRAKSSRK